MEKLTKAEEEIMHLIWQHAPTTVTQLIDRMADPKPPHSSISSIVRILEKKGFVGHTAYGRSYVYHAEVEKKAYSKFSIQGLVRNYFEGSMNNLVSFLVKEEEVDIQDIEELKRFIEKNEKP